MLNTVLTGKLKPPLQKKILDISVKPSPWFIMVIELSGVQFGLNVARVRFEITQYKVWFQKKIARQLPLVKSPLYYRHFEIAEFSQYQYEWSSTRAGGAPYVSKSTLPRKFGNHVTVHRPSTVRPHLGIPMFTLTLSSYFGSLGENWLHINVVINWRLSNKVSANQYYLTVSRAQVSRPIHVEYFLKLSADKLLVFKWSQAQV